MNLLRDPDSYTSAELAAGLQEYHDVVEREQENEIEGDGPSNPLDFPSKLKPLFLPKRYKILKGGRGGAKSWSIARALLIQGAGRALRICCFREIQKNIKESVHQLLKDQVAKLGLQDFYDVQAEVIVGRNGTQFMFAGLSTLTASSVKSYEGVDIAWVEEAQTVTARSWQLLIPTIRKQMSEIWVSMNPELETDPTYRLFVATPIDDSFVITVNWRDNPWFPAVLEAERKRAQLRMKPDEYNNIWGGQCRNAVEGAIFADEISEAMMAGRVCNVPYDYRLKAHVVLDLGWNDKMFAIVVQRGVSELRVPWAFQDDHITLAQLSARLKAKPWNWGQIWLPHDGAHGDFKTGKSTHQIFRELGWTTGTVPNVPIETGIKRARLALERTYFDQRHATDPRTVPGAIDLGAGALTNALRRYKRNLNVKSEEYGQPLHDDASHGGDAFRYVGMVAERLQNTGGSVPMPRHNVAQYPVDPEMGL